MTFAKKVDWENMFLFFRIWTEQNISDVIEIRKVQHKGDEIWLADLFRLEYSIDSFFHHRQPICVQLSLGQRIPKYFII